MVETGVSSFCSSASAPASGSLALKQDAEALLSRVTSNDFTLQLPTIRPFLTRAGYCRATITATAAAALSIVWFIVVDVHGLVVVGARLETPAPSLAEALALHPCQCPVQDGAVTLRMDAAPAASLLGGLLGLGEPHGLLDPSLLIVVTGSGGRLDARNLGLEVGEGGGAAARPLAQRAQHRGDGARGEIAQGRDGGDVDGAIPRVELGVDEARVDGADDEVLDGAGAGEAEALLERDVGQVARVAGEREQGEQAELQGLGLVEGGQARGGGIIARVGAVGEDLEEPQVGDVVGGLREGLDLRRLEKLGEDVGVGVRCRLGYEVGCCAGRRGGLRQGDEGLWCRMVWLVFLM